MRRFALWLIGRWYRLEYCLTDEQWELRRNWHFWACGHYGDIYKHNTKDLYFELPYDYAHFKEYVRGVK